MTLDNSGTSALTFLHHYFIKGLFVVPVLATLSTWLCFYYQATLELRALVTIFFAGVFFAFAVIMNTANVRRFQALDELALIKSVTMSFWPALHCRHFCETCRSDGPRSVSCLRDKAWWSVHVPWSRSACRLHAA